MYLAEDDYYEGEFRNGLYNGEGTYKNKDGSIFEGNFHNGLK